MVLARMSICRPLEADKLKQWHSNDKTCFVPEFSSSLFYFFILVFQVLMQNIGNNMFVVGFMVVQKLIINIRLKLVLQEFLALICVSALFSMLGTLHRKYNWRNCWGEGWHLQGVLQYLKSMCLMELLFVCDTLSITSISLFHTCLSSCSMVFQPLLSLNLMKQCVYLKRRLLGWM